MKTEIEVKFLDVDFDQLRAKLVTLGATCEQPMRLMRRAIIQTPALAAKTAFVRIRDEGDKVTLTYKQFDEMSLTGAKEIEVVVSNFEDTIALLDQAGLPHQSFQETKRETWRYGEVEIVLDQWPWLKPYIEIEGEDEAQLRAAATSLGFNWKDAVFGRTTSAYQLQYPDGDSSQLVNIPRVAFDLPMPTILSGQKD
jgi:adenylate cyclase class 2